jgi:hypothetical protein
MLFNHNNLSINQFKFNQINHSINHSINQKCQIRNTTIHHTSHTDPNAAVAATAGSKVIMHRLTGMKPAAM